MGARARRGAAAARPQPLPQPAVFPQLRADLVRLDAPGGRAKQDPLVGALARLRARAGAPVQFARLCADLQLSAGLADESDQQVQRLVGASVRTQTMDIWQPNGWTQTNLASETDRRADAVAEMRIHIIRTKCGSDSNQNEVGRMAFFCMSGWLDCSFLSSMFCRFIRCYMAHIYGN